MSAAASGFVRVTPAGCYFAIEGGAEGTADADEVARAELLALLRDAETPALDALDADVAERVRAHVETGLVELVDVAERLPPDSFAERLPTLLPALSERGRVVLTESRSGLFLDYAGMEREDAEEIAVLASSLRATADRSSALLTRTFGIRSRAFGIVDPAGGSEIGFWPLRIGQNVFTLTILGIPRFNTAEFRLLVWSLVERYGQTDPAAASDPTAG